MTESRRGVLYGIAAYVMWGLLPLYWPLLRPSGSVEIVAHRMVWSLGVVLLLLAATQQWSWVRRLHRRQVLLLTAAALLIAVNWGTYIWGVNNGHVIEASLGYFVNPLVSVALGVLLLQERLRPLQWVAVGIGAVAVLGLAVDYGRPPWIALVLALSFAFYGLLKKTAGVGAVEGLTVETAALFLPALGVILALHARGAGTFANAGTLHLVLLAATGIATAVPLLCFGAAANRVPLSTVGLLQYIAPVMQFILGIAVFREPMPLSRLAGFVLVWAALVLLTYDMLRIRHRSARLAASLA